MDFGDEAPVERRLRIDDIASEEKLGRTRRADDARQKPGTTIARDQAKLQEGHTELRLVGCDPHIGHTGNVTAKADCGTVDGRDQRDFEIVERLHNHVDVAAIALAHIIRAAAKGALFVTHRLDVTARREGAAFAGQDRNADAGVSLDLGAGGGNGRTITLLPQRIHHVWTCQGQRCNRAVFLKFDDRHGAFLPLGVLVFRTVYCRLRVSLSSLVRICDRCR